MNYIELLGKRYPALTDCLPEIERAAEAIVTMHRAGAKLLLCGNGGSAADCGHIVGELEKGFLSKRPLSETARRLKKRRPTITIIAYFPRLVNRKRAL